MQRDVEAQAAKAPPPEAFDLSLPGVDGESHSLSTLVGPRGTVIVFVANGCPTARAYEQRLIDLQKAIASEGVSVVAVNSNNPSLSPPDTREEMTRRAKDQKFNFPYLKDAGGELARGFGAICTPHVFLLDSDRKVVYSGRIDDSRLGARITSRDLQIAVGDVLAGRKVNQPHTEPFGCSIVW